MILFCTDDKCSFPLHTLITDTIESQGGSGVLVKILNRLGVCASLDTLSRFIQYKADSSKCNNKPRYLNPESFTVVSADNIDFMHSFARVYCGQQTSSWHGTTVQAVQPLPSLSADIQSTQTGLHTEPTGLDSTLTYFSGRSLSEDTAYFNHSSQVGFSCSVATTEEQHSEQRAMGSNLTSFFNSSQAGPSCSVATTEEQHSEQRATGSNLTSLFNSSQVGPSCSVATTEEQQHSEQRAMGSNLTSFFNSSQAGPSCSVATTEEQHSEQRATGSNLTSLFNSSQVGPSCSVATTEEQQHSEQRATGSNLTSFFNSSQAGPSCSVATTEEQHSEQRAMGSNLTSLFNSSQAGLSCFVATTLPEENQFEQHSLQAGLHIEQRATGSTFTSSHSGHSSHVHRKRTERSSPIHSPMKLTRSPVPKAQRRHRTGTEQSLQPRTIRAETPQLFSRHKAPSPQGITTQDFLMNESERDAQRDLHEEMFTLCFTSMLSITPQKS